NDAGDSNDSQTAHSAPPLRRVSDPDTGVRLPGSQHVTTMTNERAGVPSLTQDERTRPRLVTSEPSVEERIGALTVPFVPALEHVMLDLVTDTERFEHAAQRTHRRPRGVDREDVVAGARLDQQGARRDQRPQVEVA